MAVSEDALYDMSDEELEAAFKEAKAQENSPETRIEEEDVTEVEETEEVMEDVEDDVEEIDEEEVDLEEDEAEDMEQPEEDSDDDASLEDDGEEESEEDSEDEEGDLDGEPEAEDEVTDEEEKEPKAEEQPVQKRTYKANGQEFEFTDEEIFDQFGRVFGQAMNYTQKMQALKPYRKTIDAIEEAGLTHDDINLAIDVLKGDKDAIASLLKRTGTDALDLDVENTNYQPRDYGRNDTELDIKDIVEDIKGDKEYQVTYDVLERQWDNSSRQEFMKNPEMIRQLHIDVKNGMFDTIAPRANKLKVYDGGSKSDLDYYKMAAKQYFEEQADAEARQQAQEVAAQEAAERKAEQDRLAKVKADQERRKATKQASKKRKAAAPTRKAAGTKKAVDYLDDSDEAFEEWYRKLEDS